MQLLRLEVKATSGIQPRLLNRRVVISSEHRREQRPHLLVSRGESRDLVIDRDYAALRSLRSRNRSKVAFTRLFEEEIILANRAFLPNILLLNDAQFVAIFHRQMRIL